MTIRGAMTYNRYRVRRNTTEPGFVFEARNDQVSQTLLIPGLDRLNPNDLFRNGQPGGWPDPYDLTRMWVDDAGTTPATIASLGTGIGRVVTKGNAITLVQANAADRPVWGRHPVSGIRNQLTQSQEIDGSPWSNSGSTVNPVTTANDAIAPDGTLTAERVDFDLAGATGSSDFCWRYQNRAGVLTGQTWTFSFWAKAATPSDVGKQIRAGYRYLVAGNITLTADWVRYTVTETSIGDITASFGWRLRGTEINTAVSMHVWGCQAELSSTATPYQRVTNRFDITEVGSPSLYYFDFNGVNQRWRSSATVDFSGTNKVTIWSAIRKKSDASAGIVCELTSSIISEISAFSLQAPAAASPTYLFSSRGDGSGRFVAPSGFAAPTTNRLVGVGNIASPLARLIVDGVSTSTTLDQGGGNYANAFLHVGDRNGTGIRLNAIIYNLIIAGDNYDARTIQRFSDWLLKPRRLITA